MGIKTHSPDTTLVDSQCSESVSEQKQSLTPDEFSVSQTIKELDSECKRIDRYGNARQQMNRLDTGSQNVLSSLGIELPTNFMQYCNLTSLDETSVGNTKVASKNFINNISCRAPDLSNWSMERGIVSPELSSALQSVAEEDELMSYDLTNSKISHANSLSNLSNISESPRRSLALPPPVQDRLRLTHRLSTEPQGPTNKLSKEVRFQLRPRCLTCGRPGDGCICHILDKNIYQFKHYKD